MAASSKIDLRMLTGILALQVDFVTREQLASAAKVWNEDRELALDDILVKQGALQEEQRRILAPIARHHFFDGGNERTFDVANLGSISSVAASLFDLGGGESRTLESTVEVEALDSTMDRPGDLGASRLPGAGGRGPLLGDRYQVIRPHARGGLGQVSVAKDLELNRDVALKEIQSRYADDESSRSRFLVEAEVTGGLEHPGIVPVYDLGRYQDGRPFYAMRFIRGDDFKEASEQFHEQARSESAPPDFGSVEFRKLLGRFIDVCQTIEYAHSRGVLHRDLKPRNIMLGRYGETLVVDWGLAKTSVSTDLDRSSDDRLLEPITARKNEPTSLGKAIGTPAYMPPEQAEGAVDQLGPTSDVYSLGATLYSILTGRAPFEGKSSREILDKVRAGEFPGPREVQPLIPAALEAICLKAMLPKLHQRYQSCREMADDLERYLADERVSAHQETWVVRTRRWYRKHPRSVAAIAATLLVGLVSAAVAGSLLTSKNRALESTVTMRNAANDRLLDELKVTLQEKARADSNLEAAERAVDEFFVAVAESDELNRGDATTINVRRSLLTKAEAYYTDFVESNPDAELELALAEALEKSAFAKQELGRYPEAIDSYKRAIEIWANQPPGIIDESRIAKAKLSLSQCLSEVGEVAESVAIAREALDGMQFEDDVDGLNEKMEALAALGRAYATSGVVTEEVLDLMKETHRIASELHARSSDDLDGRLNLLATKFNLGEAMMDVGQPAEAESLFKEVWTLAVRWAEADPASQFRHRYLYQAAAAITDRVALAAQSGNLDVSQNLLREGEAIFEELARSKPQILEYRESWGNAHLLMAQLSIGHVVKGGLSESEVAEANELTTRELKAAIEICRYLDSRNALDYTASAYVIQGMQHFQSGEREPGIDRMSEALGIYENLTSRFPDIIEYRFDHANTYLMMGIHEATLFGNYPEGISYLENSLNLIQRMSEQEIPAPQILSYANISATYAMLADKTDAEQTARAREAIESAERLLPRLPDSPMKDGTLRQIRAAKMGLGMPAVQQQN